MKKIIVKIGNDPETAVRLRKLLNGKELTSASVSSFLAKGSNNPSRSRRA